MRADPWMIFFQKWKDPEFNPKSESFPDLHVDFKDPIDLSYSTVKKMVITPDKAKDKLYRLKNDLLAVKSKWELSGNVNDVPPHRVKEVSRNIVNEYNQCDCTDVIDRSEKENLDNTDTELVDGTKKSNFIAGYNPAVLYLWEICETNQILSDMCQQLNVDNSYDF